VTVGPEATGERSAALAMLAEDYWQALLVVSPITATVYGDRRYDDRLDDPSPGGHARHRAAVTVLLARLAEIDPAALSDADRVTHAALRSELEGNAAALDAGLEAWNVDPVGGPQITAIILESLQPVSTPVEADAMVARWRAMGPWFEAHAANLRREAAAGRIGVRSPVAKVLDQLDGLLAQPDDAWPMLAPLAVAHADWPAGATTAFADGLRAAVRDVIRPAVAEYAAVIRDDVAPVARSDDQAGLANVPGGAEAYTRLVRMHTSLPLTAEAIHAIGLEEVARIDAELAALGERVLETADLPTIRERLRSDPALHFSSGAEVFDVAERSLERARDAIGGWFGIVPVAPCVVVEIGEIEAKHSTIAYYRDPAPDGSRPGQFYINTYAPETRPRYEAEALAFHEAIPGHHLQLAISQELPDLPTFRRHLGPTAFIEGWGLYTERLSDEMGLYTGDLDRIGVLSFDAWRACRLVVDTGMHALGWTRQQAIDFMLEHTALAANNIVNEVDRYIVMPGQALAYKIGQRELLRLRAEARSVLGGRFDIRAFHDAALGQGALGLEALGESIRRWAAVASA
jgi:uncharacterized protein (DUF885 family)